MQFKKVFAVLLLIALSEIHCFKILGIMPVPGRSHYFPFDIIMKGLAEKGHKVTTITPFVRKQPVKNIEDITVDTLNSTTSELLDFEFLQMMQGNTSRPSVFHKLSSMFGLKIMSEQTCTVALGTRSLLDFLKEKPKFDVAIIEAFHTDCFFALAHILDVPIIMYSSSNIAPWYNWRIGQINNPSVIPTSMSGFQSPMTFSERLQNTILDNMMTIIFYNMLEPSNYENAKRILGQDIPPFKEIVSRASLVLVNSHFSYHGPKATIPGYIEIGGLHLPKEVKKVPANIENWINESEHGVIYFSMGSMIKGHTFPEDKRKIFLRAFGRLKQRVLWKWENDTMPGKPDNVMIQKWMPQFDILCHPNVKAFISHGGLLGTTEAVHCGVPVVVMPQFGDQHTNAKALEAGNGGVILNFREADEEAVYKALTTVLDPEFNKKAKELSARFRDRPMSPMDTAIYWIEYVARHKGAHHMRTAAVGMPLYQYLLLDVFAFLALVAIVALLVVFYTLKFLLSFLKSFFVPQKKLKSQ